MDSNHVQEIPRDPLPGNSPGIGWVPVLRGACVVSLGGLCSHTKDEVRMTHGFLVASSDTCFPLYRRQLSKL